MRIALPLYEDDISPRFCGADRFLIVDIEGNREVGRRLVAPVPFGFGDRLVLLRDLGVRELLCGGFNLCYLPLAESLDLRVRWGLWGPADAILRDRIEGREPASASEPKRCSTLLAGGGRGGRGGCARKGRRL